MRLQADAEGRPPADRGWIRGRGHHRCCAATMHRQDRTLYANREGAYGVVFPSSRAELRRPRAASILPPAHSRVANDQPDWCQRADSLSKSMWGGQRAPNQAGEYAAAAGGCPSHRRARRLEGVPHGRFPPRRAEETARSRVQRARAPAHLAQSQGSQGIPRDAGTGSFPTGGGGDLLGRPLLLPAEDTPCAPATLSRVGPLEADNLVTEGRYHRFRRMFATLAVPCWSCIGLASGT